MDYTEALTRLERIPGEEILSAPAALGITLLKDAGENYKFMRYLAKGGEAIIILAFDSSLEKQIIGKFALPLYIEPPEVPEGKLRRKKNVFLKFLQATNEKEKRELQKEWDTENSARFYRGCLIQKELHKILTENQAYREFGYIPDVYKLNKAPHLWCIMEFVAGDDLVTWCRERKKKEILELFFKMVSLVEILHDYKVVHSDLTPHNFLVNGGYPVLLDFTIAKNKSDLRKITSFNTRNANPFFASDHQLDKFWNRNYADDIFLLANTFWCMWAGGYPRMPPDPTYEQIREQFSSSMFPFGLEQIYRKATANLHGLRYSDITDFKSDIKRILDEYSEENINEEKLKIIAEQITRLQYRTQNIETILGNLAKLFGSL